MEQVFKVEGMSCNHCVMAVKKELNKAGIINNIVEIGKVIVTSDDASTTADQIIKAIESAGYRVVKT